MKEAWNYYLMAFKNAFDYKSTATRKELNWFLTFYILFWCLINIFYKPMMAKYGATAITPANPDEFDKIMSGLMSILVTILIKFAYNIINLFPLISLVKRRFNYITPGKAGLFLFVWFCCWIGAITLSCVYVFIAQNVYLYWLIKILAIVPLGMIIFLMMRKKPFN